MRIWHMTADAGREPLRVAPGQMVRLVIGTSPIEPGQAVTITYDVVHPNGTADRGFLSVPWHHNSDDASYWSTTFGPFAQGDQVTYRIHGSSPEGPVDLPPVHFAVGPRLYLGLLWHQHQPSYLDMAQPPHGRMTQPWVRLHALRGYYAMAALSAEVPAMRVMFNLTPVLLQQIEQYLEQDVSDWELDLTRKPVKRLTPGERETILDTFFEADWRNDLLPHPRYLELYERRREQEPFSDQDIRDLQMWYNLIWFAPQFRTGEVALPTGQRASVRRFVEQEGAFSDADIEAMIAEQYKILAAILPLYRQLQDQGLIEVSTTPFYHPILPLIFDGGLATIDRPGACMPPRFRSPEDAETQVARAIDFYRQRFGRLPRGMWPAEGAVSPEVIPIFVRHDIEWIASDQGVLAKSGRWGYDAGDPNVLCRPYQIPADNGHVGIFFRDAGLSNLIGFHYHQAYTDMELAAQDFVHHVLHDVADRLPSYGDRILSIILDGENTWSAYGNQAPDFLRALYHRLSQSPEIEPVTFSEYLHGNPERRVAEHPPEVQEQVCELFTGSWIDEAGSEPGVDLGTWAGEPDENQAWGLLADAREALSEAGVTPADNPQAFEALYAAEGSDWFWWLGTDHPLPYDSEFEAIFRLHLHNAYRFAGLEPPPALDRPLVPWSLAWTLVQPRKNIGPHEQLMMRTNCPGTVIWRLLPSREQGEVVLQPVAGLAQTVRYYEAKLGPFGDEVREVRINFRCQEHRAEEMVCVQEVERLLPAGS